MPIPGDSKRMCCHRFGRETVWEYTVVQLGDGLFEFENAIQPEAHQIRMWRCQDHTTSEGRLKESSNHEPRQPANVV